MCLNNTTINKEINQRQNTNERLLTNSEIPEIQYPLQYTKACRWNAYDSCEMNYNNHVIFIGQLWMSGA